MLFSQSALHTCGPGPKNEFSKLAKFGSLNRALWLNLSELGFNCPSSHDFLRARTNSSTSFLFILNMQEFRCKQCPKISAVECHCSCGGHEEPSLCIGTSLGNPRISPVMPFEMLVTKFFHFHDARIETALYASQGASSLPWHGTQAV